MPLRNLSESSLQRALSSIAPLDQVEFALLDRTKLATPNKAELARFAKSVERSLIGKYMDADVLLVAARVRRP